MLIKKVVHKSTYFSLSKVNKPMPGKRGKGKRYYVITRNWAAVSLTSIADDRWMQQVLKDDYRISSHSWEYSNQSQAEKIYNMLLMKWA